MKKYWFCGRVWKYWGLVNKKMEWFHVFQAWSNGSLEIKKLVILRKRKSVLKNNTKEK